jgi:hypothetical protein
VAKYRDVPGCLTRPTSGGSSREGRARFLATTRGTAQLQSWVDEGRAGIACIVVRLEFWL